MTAPPAAARAPIARRLQTMAPSPTVAADAKAKEMQRCGVRVLNLSVGEPDFDTPEHIKEAATRALREGRTKYTLSGGMPELKEAIREKFARENGVEYAPNEVVACVGGKQALYNVFLAICDPEDEVLIPVPTWPTFVDQVTLVGARPVLVPLPEDFRLRGADLVPYLSPRTRAVVLNSPSNPTGAVMDPEQIRAVTELAVSRGIYVISDETYEHFLYDGRRHVAPAALSPEAKEWVIEVNTVSKTYAMTGWRIGYAAGPAPVIAAVNLLMTQITHNPTTIAQWAAVEALRGPQDSVRNMVREFARRREFFIAGLRDAGFDCATPEGAFYAFPHTPGDCVAAAARLLEEAHVNTVPGAAFFRDGHIRLSYAAPMEVLEEAVERLKKFAC